MGTSWYSEAMSYDFKHWSSREKHHALTVPDETVTEIAKSNPNLDENIVREVIDAINWTALADKPGTVRVHPRGEVMAIRVPDVRTPWEVVWFNGRGGGTAVYDYHTWTKVWEPE